MTAEKKAVKKFQMTMNLDEYEKLKIIAEKNQRSVVGQVAYWVYQSIEQYESENGAILSLVQNTNNGNGKFIANTAINMQGA